MHRVVIMLGGNVGDTVCVFESVIRSLVLKQHQLISISSIYRTKPWGYFNQRDFLNQLLVLDTAMGVDEFHENCLEIEQLHGKNKEFENGPRSLDIDILFFDELVLQNQILTIPHPRLHQRMFNLVPLCEVLPDFVHPVFNKKMTELLEGCEDLDQPEILMRSNHNQPCS